MSSDYRFRGGGPLGRSFIRALTQQAELDVVVLGPKEKDPRAFKREQIRSALQVALPASRVVFHEDSDVTMRLTEAVGQDILAQSLELARSAHIIVALDIGEGVMTELAMFAVYPDICQKIVLLSHQRFESGIGLPSHARKKIPEYQRYYYSDEQFASCDVAKVLAVRAARAQAVRQFNIMP